MVWYTYPHPIFHFKALLCLLFPTLFCFFLFALHLFWRSGGEKEGDNKESAKTPDENKEAANAFLPPPLTPSLSFMSSLFTLHLARLTSVAVFLRSLSPPSPSLSFGWLAKIIRK